MTLWLRSHADPVSLALLLVSVVSVSLVGSVPMPIVRLGLGGAPFTVLLPAIAATGILGLVQRGLPVYEAVAVRPTPLLLRCSLTSLFLIAAAITLLLGGQSIAVTATRNLCGYTGLALLTLWLLGSVAALAVAPALAVVVAVLGSSDTDIWWPIRDGSHLPSLAIAGLLCLLGVWFGSTRWSMRARAGGTH